MEASVLLCSQLKAVNIGGHLSHSTYARTYRQYILEYGYYNSGIYLQFQ